jgi:hypothetical protein
MRILVLAVAGIVFLSGCAGLNLGGSVSDLNRDLRGKQVSFVLNQEITIRPGKARSVFQDGIVTGATNAYRPFCILEVDSVDHSGYPVAAETFEVARIQRSTVQIVSRDDRRLASASLRLGRFDGGTQRFHDGYHFWLKSDKQPGVSRLTCYGVYAAPVDLRPPTLEEINATLGAIGMLRAE